MSGHAIGVPACLLGPLRPRPAVTVYESAAKPSWLSSMVRPSAGIRAGLRSPQGAHAVPERGNSELNPGAETWPSARQSRSNLLRGLLRPRHR
jgi:hypothetical protein